MDLECQIEAYPPPAIKWYMLGKSDPLTTNQHFRIAHFVNDDQHVNTILRAVTIEKISIKSMCAKLQIDWVPPTPQWNYLKQLFPSVPLLVTKLTTVVMLTIRFW